MDRDIALKIKDALLAIQTAVETIAVNTTPADGGGEETPPGDGEGGT